MTRASVFDELLEFLRRLRASHLHFSLDIARDDAVMVTVIVPGERWEVEFLQDGQVDVERFTSDGTILDRSALEELFRFADTTERGSPAS